MFSNVAKVMLFISNTQSYVPITLCKLAVIIHVFTIRWRLTPDKIKHKKNWIWDVLEIEWKEISVTLNGNEIKLPSSVILSFGDKFRVRKLLRKQLLLLHVMLKTS